MRIYRPTSSSQLDLPTTIPLPDSRLEWGFAGTSTGTPAIDGRPAHTVWTHWVDSTSLEEIKDEGDMYPQDDGTTLEYGSMVNSAKGKEEKYEECWIDGLVKVLKGETKRRSWCWRAEGSEGEKGVIVRIGQFVQGVLRRGNEVSVGRWGWNEDKWETIVTIGEFDVPGVVFEIGKGVSAGDRVEETVDGLIWECVEVYEWS